MIVMSRCFNLILTLLWGVSGLGGVWSWGVFAPGGGVCSRGWLLLGGGVSVPGGSGLGGYLVRGRGCLVWGVPPPPKIFF